MPNLVGASLRVITCIVALLVLGLPLHGQQATASVSRDVAEFLAGNSSRPLRVIATGNSERVRAAGRRVRATERRLLARGVSLELTREQLRDLVSDGDVEHLSVDLPVTVTMDVTNPTVGADQVWAGWGGLLLGVGSYPGVTGRGVAVAVIDSGIAASHPAFTNRIVASVDLASGATGTNDEYGHGTHVAGIIAGRASAAAGITSHYTGGVAPGARLVNVRVLGADGAGLTSDVIAGIDWVIANRQRNNIRVINLSLGHPVLEPSTTDPLCQAVARAVTSGIVVVASAGNAGRAKDGRIVLGGISSPGNCPFAITVGALSAKGTTTRNDDTVASYSSRGPTKFEFAVKPDVVAPGTRLLAPESANSYIPSNYPAFHTAGSGNNGYMTLSGTSMAAAVVSGGAALLLQANPNLTPVQVKLALQTTSAYMADAGLIGAGAGSVNLRAARQVASDGLLPGLVTRVAGSLVATSGAVFWDGGTMIQRLHHRIGLRLLDVLELPFVWLDPARIVWDDLNLLGLDNPLATVAPNYIVWGEVAGWTNSEYIVWGDSVVTPEGDYIVWGENSEDYIVWGESATPEEGDPSYIIWGESTRFPDEP